VTTTTYTDPAEGMKMGMRRLAKGVTVISLVDGEGNRHAMTASAVTSLSDDPASLLICVNKTASLAEFLEDGADFCVNVLAQGMGELSNLCAGKEKGEARFAVGDWRLSENLKLPYIADAEAAFFCVNDQVSSYGTHLICVGCIDEVMTCGAEANPLVYVDAAYHDIVKKAS